MDLSDILNNLNKIAGNVAIACLLINVGLYFFHFKNLGTPFQRLFYFLVWSLMIEISARVFAFWGINNLPLLHIYTLGEFILLSWFYKSLLTKPVLFQSRYWYFVIVGSILIIFNSIFFQSIYGFNSLAKTFVQIIVISYAVLYFYNLTANQSPFPSVEKSLRLINSAILIYYSGSLFIFMCGQISFGNADTYKIFWIFNAVLNLVFQLLILWGTWKVVFRKTELSS